MRLKSPKVLFWGSLLMKGDVKVEKQHEEPLQVGILFSRNAKKTHTDQRILQVVFALSEKK